MSQVKIVLADGTVNPNYLFTQNELMPNDAKRISAHFGNCEVSRDGKTYRVTNGNARKVS